MKQLLFILFALISASSLLAQMDQPLELRCVNPKVAASEIRSIAEGSPSKLTTTPVNQLGEHISLLDHKDFIITKGKKSAEIIDVKELTAVESTVMRVIFMVDNSQSMSPYLSLLQTTLENVIKRFSKAVRVSIIFFSEGKQAQPVFTYGGKALPLVRLPYTKDKQRAVTYAKNLLAERLLTRNTYLFDGVFATIHQIQADTGNVDRSFAIIFSDGVDNASVVDPGAVLEMQKFNTVFFTIDYLTKENDFLVKLAKGTGGDHFQAKSADELTSVFDAIANKIVAKGYEITYQFKDPPTASIEASTKSLVMEEEIVRETFPLLNYIFFQQGSSVIPERYVKLTAEQPSRFDESSIEGGAMDFYYNALNIIGSRMKKIPSSTITVAGYLNDFGNEKKNAILAMDRARIVQSYLSTIWDIPESRIKITTGNLPPIPSSSKDEDGRAENCRVEITSEDWEIMKPVTFVRRSASVDPPTVQFQNTVNIPEGIATWALRIEQNGKIFDLRKGTSLEPKITWNWKNQKGEAPASSGDLLYSLVVTDDAGDLFETPKSAITIREIKRERDLNIVLEEGITKEKISLILFPFDVAKPGPKNEQILDGYVFPRLTRGSRVIVTGYTDTIGSEEYNLKLSQNRAEEVYKIIRAKASSLLAEEDLTYIGLGETSPIFTNDSPEGRFYNRTVSLLLEKVPMR